jgi:hypothetical protein
MTISRHLALLIIIDVTGGPTQTDMTVIIEANASSKSGEGDGWIPGCGGESRGSDELAGGGDGVGGFRQGDIGSLPGLRSPRTTAG